ncbi:MAG: hypothetical protein PHU80_09045, partial [Kiritimatiellae bacterium]|nr:hypothetical protein [Kiritimatiellia bacterium]
MKYVFRLLSRCALAAAAHSAGAAAYTLELRNTSHARENAVASHVVTRAWADNADTHALFEITDKKP